MSTLLLSLWRNDAGRDLRARVEHLLQKPTPGLRWWWVIGNSEDETESWLRDVAAVVPAVTVLRIDTTGPRATPADRLARVSETADAALAQLPPTVRRVLMHESDLRSPPDVAARLDGTDDEAVAGWPTIQHRIDAAPTFYDTFGFRAQGRRFDGSPPYHPVYRPDRRFEVDTVGSCWSMPAWAIRAGAREGAWGSLGLCASLRALGVRILVDPTVPVVQPLHLWESAVGRDGEPTPMLRPARA